jgi:MYXO-CTERM domain-containing protein
MRRTFASMVLALFFFSLPFTSTAQTTGGGSGIQQSGQQQSGSGQPGSTTGSAADPQSPGSGRTYGEVNNPNAPGYQSDEARGGFDFGWLGLLGLAGLLGLRHANRQVTATR